MSNILNKLKERVAQVADEMIAPEEIRSVRLNTCINCENLIKITRQCSKCLCIIDAKILVRKNKCPIGKW